MIDPDDLKTWANIVHAAASILREARHFLAHLPPRSGGQHPKPWRPSRKKAAVHPRHGGSCARCLKGGRLG